MKSEKMANVLTTVERHLGALMSHHALGLGESGISGMGEWFVTLENNEFVVIVSRDRGGYEAIEIGSKLRPRPRAPKRQWSLSHLRGFLEERKDHYPFKSLKDQVAWLEENEAKLLDTSLINSYELNKWAVKASRRLFGQRR